ncbi:unnamed protein product, partial [marine sediment metagenome]
MTVTKFYKGKTILTVHNRFPEDCNHQWKSKKNDKTWQYCPECGLQRIKTMDTTKIKKIKIKKPFYGAGSVYKWTKDGFHIHGIGINTKYLDNHTTLKIEVNKKITLIRTEDIKKFAKKYNSFRNINNSIVQVAVISLSLLDPSLKPVRKEN